MVETCHPIAEAALLDAARSGDEAAVSSLLASAAPGVRRFAWRMCGNAADADDVLQETLLAAARGLPEFRGEASFSTWLFGIARSFCQKQRRRSKFAPQTFSALDDEGAAAEPTEDPEQLNARREFVELLDRAIAQLDPGPREVLVLRDIEGFSLEQIASIQESSVGAVKSTLHRARARLRSLLEDGSFSRAKPAAPACPDVAELFSRYLEGEIGHDECVIMQAHVDQCSSCSHACQLLERALGRCRSLSSEAPSEEVQRSIQGALRRVVRAT